MVNNSLKKHLWVKLKTIWNNINKVILRLQLYLISNLFVIKIRNINFVLIY